MVSTLGGAAALPSSAVQNREVPSAVGGAADCARILGFALPARQTDDLRAAAAHTTSRTTLEHAHLSSRGGSAAAPASWHSCRWCGPLTAGSSAAVPATFGSPLSLVRGRLDLTPASAETTSPSLSACSRPGVSRHTATHRSYVFLSDTVFLRLFLPVSLRAFRMPVGWVLLSAQLCATASLLLLCEYPRAAFAADCAALLLPHYSLCSQLAHLLANFDSCPAVRSLPRLGRHPPVCVKRGCIRGRVGE